MFFWLSDSYFRCPICREAVILPRGGVSNFPPSFIVNQLLDLIKNQRRDYVPLCKNHPHEELLFCETCDCQFCGMHMFKKLISFCFKLFLYFYFQKKIKAYAMLIVALAQMLTT